MPKTYRVVRRQIYSSESGGEKGEVEAGICGGVGEVPRRV